MTDPSDIAIIEPHLEKPPTWLSLSEFTRVLPEMAMIMPFHRFLKNLPSGDGHPVIVIPGFSADNKTTAILRYYLNHWGYAAEPWELDQNIDPRAIGGFEGVIAFKEMMAARVGERIQELYELSGKKVTLIGWSLGGVFSRVLASENQEAVKHVITLGTPFGDPRTVPIYKLMEKWHKKPMTKSHLDAWLSMCNAPIGDVKLSILFSKSDGFVSKTIAHNHEGESQEAVHVCSSHVGFAVNPMVLYLVADRLQEGHQSWAKYKPSGKLTRFLYRHH